MRPVRRLANEIYKADLVLVGGGTLLQDYYLGSSDGRSWWPVVCLLTRTPFVITAVGAEGLDRGLLRRCARFVCRRAVGVSTRDALSLERVRRISDVEPALSADPMFLKPLPRLAHRTKSDVIAVNLRADASDLLVSNLAVALRARVDRGARVLLVAMDRREDEDATALSRFRRALDRDDACTALPSSATWRELADLLSASVVCVGMRLHFMIFATLAGAPIVALTSLPKTAAFVADAGVSQCSVDADLPDLEQALRHAAPVEKHRIETLCTRAETALDLASPFLR